MELLGSGLPVGQSQALILKNMGYFYLKSRVFRAFSPKNQIKVKSLKKVGLDWRF